MQRTAAWLLALAFLGGPGRAQDAWPRDMAQIEALVRSAVGGVSFERVKVRRHGKAVEVSIGLESLPQRFVSKARRNVNGESVFLATNFVQLFMDDPDVAEFHLMPDNAHLVDHFFGMWVFNFGKRVKLPAEISVIGQEDQGQEIRNRKKKFKVNKKTLTLRVVEGQVSGPGFYALQTVVGPHSLTTYFCNGC